MKISMAKPITTGAAASTVFREVRFLGKNLKKVGGR
jgi:hypothetical protein